MEDGISSQYFTTLTDLLLRRWVLLLSTSYRCKIRPPRVGGRIKTFGSIASGDVDFFVYDYQNLLPLHFLFVEVVPNAGYQHRSRSLNSIQIVGICHEVWRADLHTIF